MSSSNNSVPPTANPENNRPVEIVLAGWVDRFVAWLIDFIIVSIALGILFALISFPFWFFVSSNDIGLDRKNFEPFHYLLSSLAFFGYWTYFEHASGQPTGKRLLKIKTTNLSGKELILGAPQWKVLANHSCFPLT
jgi:uncharacterized RDD family membrane protein YckC